jgi:anti-sigma regulatory factor (Ser/Thr protein kinase)/Na+-translocating ferredoxin:NAD+ oxidoreductase RNF subunit RnfB
MSTACYRIVGGDFERGGSASSHLKESLKRVGAEPQAIRRAVIAAYEAEMNVVIHAHSAEMLVRFHDSQVDVEVSDRGPGIPDIELAMREGYSTAPPAARELGFGAGMGLPNIRKSADVFSIESSVGRGTRLRFSVAMQHGEGVKWERNSLRLVGESCTACLRCLASCPTQALRVYGGSPRVLGHLCVDCTNCVEACLPGAIGVDASDVLPDRLTGTVVVPAALLAQFGDASTAEMVPAALRELGFDGAVVAAAADEALREAVIAWARAADRVRPVISPACPAIVNLVQVRFPSLIPHVAPFLSPSEAAARSIAGDGVFVAACPAQCTAVTEGPVGTSPALVSPAAVRQALVPLVADTAGHAPKSVEPPRREATAPEDVLQVYGIRRVMRLLDSIEDGLYENLTIVEPYACELGCFGSPLFWEDPFVARRRWLRIAAGFEGDATAVRRDAPLRAREGVRLDADMDRAIAKLARIEGLTRSLPGKDCGMCGAPGCSTFAEDVVLGRATVAGCTRSVGAQEESQ